MTEKDKLLEKYEEWKKPLLEGKIYVPYCERIQTRPTRTGLSTSVIVINYNPVDYPVDRPPDGYGYIAKRKAIEFNGEKTIALEYYLEKL